MGNVYIDVIRKDDNTPRAIILQEDRKTGIDGDFAFITRRLLELVDFTNNNVYLESNGIGVCVAHELDFRGIDYKTIKPFNCNLIKQSEWMG